jgi:hypothetical protein
MEELEKLLICVLVLKVRLDALEESLFVNRGKSRLVLPQCLVEDRRVIKLGLFRLESKGVGIS